MFKKINKKGFTLAELLIVVAIIGVLVAISIPIFTAQLNKAKYAADEANARSIYAEMTADYIMNEGKGHSTNFEVSPASITKGTSGEITVKHTDGSTNKFKFSGIVAVTCTVGTSTTYPKVELGECSEAGAAAVTFGSGTAPTTTTGD